MCLVEKQSWDKGDKMREAIESQFVGRRVVEGKEVYQCASCGEATEYESGQGLIAPLCLKCYERGVRVAGYDPRRMYLIED